MIELLLSLIIIAEITGVVFLILKIRSLEYKITDINQQIKNFHIEEISKTTRETVTNIKKSVLFFIQSQKSKETYKNTKLIINTIFAVIALLKNKKQANKVKT